jgi:hypothetical protein
VPELIGAQPSAVPVARVARRGAEEGKGSTGVPVLGSPGLGRRRRGGMSVVKAVAGRTPVRVSQGLEMGQGGAVGGGDARAPFYRVGGGAGRPGIGGERAAILGGDRPGWWWGEMRCGAPAVTGAEGAPRGGGAGCGC